MTKQEILDRIYNIIDNHNIRSEICNHHELDLLRSDLEDDIIWENKMKKYRRKGK